MPEIRTEQQKIHNAVLQNRKHLCLTGVLDVEKFDESSVVLYTELGKLSVRGTELNIAKLEINDLEGELVIDGEIDIIEYSKGKRQAKKGNFFSKLLG